MIVKYFAWLKNITNIEEEEINDVSIINVKTLFLRVNSEGRGDARVFNMNWTCFLQILSLSSRHELDVFLTQMRIFE